MQTILVPLWTTAKKELFQEKDFQVYFEGDIG
jgi:hypothetical protein